MLLPSAPRQVKTLLLRAREKGILHFQLVMLVVFIVKVGVDKVSPLLAIASGIDAFSCLGPRAGSRLIWPPSAVRVSMAHLVAQPQGSQNATASSCFKMTLLRLPFGFAKVSLLGFVLSCCVAFRASCRAFCLWPPLSEVSLFAALRSPRSQYILFTRRDKGRSRVLLKNDQKCRLKGRSTHQVFYPSALGSKHTKVSQVCLLGCTIPCDAFWLLGHAGEFRRRALKVVCEPSDVWMALLLRNTEQHFSSCRRDLSSDWPPQNL